ncbi:hypothetical protein K438DRAFT_1755395 [Mycena galopus ATCC 62051]|nr:hypothetical protein K438DRAFT_1755395 [Mycena galopus ATCC 62051]
MNEMSDVKERSVEAYSHQSPRSSELGAKSRHTSRPASTCHPAYRARTITKTRTIGVGLGSRVFLIHCYSSSKATTRPSHSDSAAFARETRIAFYRAVPPSLSAASLQTGVYRATTSTPASFKTILNRNRSQLGVFVIYVAAAVADISPGTTCTAASVRSALACFGAVTCGIILASTGACFCQHNGWMGPVRLLGALSSLCPPRPNSPFPYHHTFSVWGYTPTVKCLPRPAIPVFTNPSIRWKQMLSFESDIWGRDPLSLPRTIVLVTISVPCVKHYLRVRRSSTIPMSVVKPTINTRQTAASLRLRQEKATGEPEQEAETIPTGEELNIGGRKGGRRIAD